MADETTLTPQQARVKFGDLTDPATRTHKHFETPEGEWRPAFGPGMTLAEYRLFKRQGGATKVWRPQSKPKR